MNNKTALLIIDVQLGMFDENYPVYKGNELLKTLHALISRARGLEIPVIFIQHNGGAKDDPIHPENPGWVIHPSIQPESTDVIIQKNHPDSFQETQLQQKLERLGITDLVLAGIQTEFCVDTTCRRAYSLGYNVTLVQDGHSTWDTEELTAPQIIAHHNQNLGGWFATLKSADEIELK